MKFLERSFQSEISTPMICPCYSGSRCKSTSRLTSTYWDYWVAWNSNTQMLHVWFFNIQYIFIYILHLTFDWLESMVNVGNYSIYGVSGIDHVQYIIFQPLQDDPREKPTSRYMCLLRSRMGQQYSELTEISWGQEKLKSVPSLKLT